MTDYNLGNILDPDSALWVGNFGNLGRDQLLMYNAQSADWSLFDFAGALKWKKRGNTVGFGNLLDGGHPFWIGRFTAAYDQVLFYFVGDGNWWLGDLSDPNLPMVWRNVANTKFGNLLDGGHPLWVGDFDHAGNDSLLFYFAGDNNWWHGKPHAGAMSWTLVDITGFGNLVDGHHYLWSGDFDGNGRDQVLFHYFADRNWWSGELTADSSKLTWSRKGKTQTRTILARGHGEWVGRFNSQLDRLMLYDALSREWHLSRQEPTTGAMKFARVATAAPFDEGLLTSRYSVRSGQFLPGRGDQMLVQDSSNGRWWLGRVSAGKLTWKSPGETSGFGNVLSAMHRTWAGNFLGSDRLQLLMHYAVDGNWFVGDIPDDASMHWTHKGTTNKKAAPLPMLKPSYYFHDAGDNSKGFWSQRAIVARDVTLAGWIVGDPHLGRNKDRFFPSGSEDWHYSFYPDPDFIDSTYGKNPGNLVAARLTGNEKEVRLPPAPAIPFCVPGVNPVTADSFLLPATQWGFVNAELNSWHVRPTPTQFVKNDKGEIIWPGTLGQGRGPKPPGWIDDPERTPNQFYNDAWPWDPRPSAEQPFAKDDYVIINGTLWQDSGHPSDPPHPRGMKWDETFANHGGWLEIHPVDAIRRAPELEPAVRKHTAVVSAIAHPLEEWVEDQVLTHPLPQPPGHSLHFKEIIDFRYTRTSDAAPYSRTVERVENNTKLHVRVRVVGVKAPVWAWAGSCTFKATYILWWAP